MLSLNRIRNNTDEIKAGINSKNESINLDEILNLDSDHREKIHELDGLRAERNKSSDAIAESKRFSVRIESGFNKSKYGLRALRAPMLHPLAKPTFPWPLIISNLGSSSASELISRIVSREFPLFTSMS